MSLEAIYKGRQARYVDDYVLPGQGWIGAILDYGDGLWFGVKFGDSELVIDPSDDEWNGAMPLRTPFTGGIYVTLPDGSRAWMRN